MRSEVLFFVSLDLLEGQLGLPACLPPGVSLGDIDLDREPEQMLSQIVVEESRHLQSLVLSFPPRVRERAQQLLAILQLLVRFLERFASGRNTSAAPAAKG